MNSLAQILDRLKAIEPSASIFPPVDGVLMDWFNDAVADLFLRYAIEHPQDRMKVHRLEFSEGGFRPNHCHETCLALCTMRPELVPWFGFCLLEEDGVTRFWIHSRATDEAMTTRYEAEPTASHSTRFVGLQWSREFFRALGKKPGARAGVPYAMRRSLLDQPLTKEMRRWASH